MPLSKEAIVYERLELCQMLIKAGASLDSPVPTEPPIPRIPPNTQRNPDRLTDFTDNEANFCWAPNYPYLGPLHLAAIVDNLEIVELFLSCCADTGASAGAVVPGHKEATRILLENGANANFLSPGWGTLLHIAQDSKIAQLLIAFGADIGERGLEE
ncbi:hypothetical protein TSTA_012860 [Talaromyces stipitatus ATCC 10500]|uniref:Ankyrin repeat-containing protein n=1 Tax=Talaromyces stipitatus (strain ATCC 10500 / CBS 375.48 / QM 6759 / NRRL 1006) TaxID=441959 RepID=B8MF80_TALSN|nr:uncharacterized protein TSTA_012860 [Talaromyces stipitatus ATCC 10500]EED16179.1 hypothetical protein TSTA_012860 [Talaromyces stipitatus ATCC 10500]